MTIIAAVDESEKAGSVIEEAAYLASELGLDLHVIHIMNFESIKSDPEELGESTSIKEQATAIAEELASKHADEFHAIGLIGQPKEEIVSYAKKHNARYIVTSGRKRSPTGKAMFGSTSQYVILHADCPVLNVPEKK